MKRLTAKEIRPEGWLKKQLEIQAAGLAGNLDRVWPDIRDSKWIGQGRMGARALLAGRIYSPCLSVAGRGNDSPGKEVYR